ncbi:MAG TPA: glycosyltransferase [Solirubrobacteraceae bacterium]|nr:glycosyltransferase [Solirubrobacteraceae bacterium]
MEDAVRLDIVIPAHNEEHRIGRTLEGYCERLRDPELRFIVALDDCTDRTEQVVRRQMGRDGRVHVLALPKLGKGGVIRTAFARSDADLVGFVDADGATPPGELMRLAEAAGQADGAIASRRHPAAVVPVPRPLARRLTSVGFALGVRALLGLRYRDTQCGAKVLRRESADRLLPRLTSSDFAFDVDLLLAAREEGQQIVELPTVWIDRSGSRVRPLRDTGAMGGSLLRLWARQRARATTAAAHAGA